jgi:hypothetical protein
MTDTLTLESRTPNWIDALCQEIDTLKFTSAFDCFSADAVLSFGVKQISGAPAMQAFFVQIDAPLDIDHRILEVWAGSTTTYVRGEADMAKKESPQIRVVAPFMWLFRREHESGPITHWYVTAGPLATDKVL